MLIATLIGIVSLGVAYGTGALYTRSYLMRELMSEEKLHIADPSRWGTISQGTRREPLKLSDAENHSNAVRLAASHYSRLWPHTLMRLRKPLGDTGGIARSQEIALRSQRVALQVKLMRKGLEESPLMVAVSDITSDKEFARANELVDSIATGNDSRLKSFAREIAMNSDQMNHQPVTILESKKLNSSRKLTLESPIALPMGYSWDSWITNKGESFAKLHIAARDSSGTVVLGNSFYLNNYSDFEGELEEKQRKIKRSIVNQLRLIAS